MNWQDSDMTIERFEFIKGFSDASKVRTISKILVSLPFIENDEMYALAVDCLDYLANMSDETYDVLYNDIQDDF
ncbi:MAG: hypothetical protein HFF02_07865 [Erysipelotrichaceae bacterium]|nr:hypothetical protein [Erysipelotrichaceae bacterium]